MLGGQPSEGVSDQSSSGSGPKQELGFPLPVGRELGSTRSRLKKSIPVDCFPDENLREVAGAAVFLKGDLFLFGAVRRGCWYPDDGAARKSMVEACVGNEILPKSTSVT